MALRDLQTNLRSLQFGNDTPGGGSSGLPYIKNGLPEDSPAGEYLAGIARNSMDWPLRGGAYSTVASTTDSVRISRFLTDLPRGYIFTSKQVQLQKSNPRTETGGFTSRLNTQTYNLNANLLAQVFEQGTGIHIPRPGANANELGPDNPQAKYEWIVSNKDTNQNRLVALYSSKIQQDSTGLSLDSTSNKLGISLDDNILLDYEMGPDSLYGDGNTTIFRTVNTTTSFDRYVSKGFTQISYNPNFKVLSQNAPYSSSYIAAKWNIPNGFLGIKDIRDDFNLEDNTTYQQSDSAFIRPEAVPIGISPINYFGNTMGYSALLASREGNDLSAPPKLQDFRTASLNNNSLALNYNSSLVRIETRLQLGDPGVRTRGQRKFINQTNGGLGQDKINLLPLYQSSGDPIQANSVRDMIKFCIEVINNNEPNTTVPLHFRAYITDLSDNIGAEWDSKRYMGRGENFYTYQGFTREVSFNLKVAAQSKQEMMPLYQKLNYLASSLMPDYNSNGFMKGNLHKLTVGEWFYRTPGILKSMNVSIENDYSWEIKFTEPETRKFGTSDFQKSKNVVPSQHFTKNNKAEGSLDFQDSNSDADMMELPQVLSINFTFSPILNNLPRLAKEGSLFTTSSILISSHGDNENFIKRIVN